MDNNYPLFSCIIITYNKFLYLFDAISSVLNQNYSNIELIVSDDGSVEFPEEDVKKYIEKNKGNNLKRYNIIHQKINIGTVKNINSALKIIKGEYFFIMGGDDMLYELYTINKIVEKFNLMGSNIISFCRQRCTEKEMKPIKLMPDKKLLKYINKLNSAKSQYLSFSKGMFYDAYSGSGVSYKTSFIKQMGYFDERYHLIEDATFFLKITRLGYKIDNSFEVVSTKYREGGISNGYVKEMSKVTKMQIQDMIELYKAEIEPNENKFPFWQRRYMKYVQLKRCLLITKNIKNFNLKQIYLAVKYPDSILQSIIYKIFRKVYKVYN